MIKNKLGAIPTLQDLKSAQNPKKAPLGAHFCVSRWDRWSPSQKFKAENEKAEKAELKKEINELQNAPNANPARGMENPLGGNVSKSNNIQYGKPDFKEGMRILREMKI